MTKADLHTLLVSLYEKKGGKKDLNKDTEIIIDLRRALVTALQNAPPLAYSQIIKKSGETVPSAGWLVQLSVPIARQW